MKEMLVGLTGPAFGVQRVDTDYNAVPNKALLRCIDIFD